MFIIKQAIDIIAGVHLPTHKHVLTHSHIAFNVGHNGDM